MAINTMAEARLVAERAAVEQQFPQNIWYRDGAYYIVRRGFKGPGDDAVLTLMVEYSENMRA